MQRDPRLEALFGNQHKPSKPVGLFQKIVAIAVAVVVFGLALTFSVMFLAVVVAAGAVVGGYLWWKTRDLRRAIRQAQAQANDGGPLGRRARREGGIVIEGEVVREVDEERRADPRG